MSVHELDISWAATATERRQLQRQLLACDEVRGAFLTGRDETLAVLFEGDRERFDAWSRSIRTTARAVRETT